MMRHYSPQLLAAFFALTLSFTSLAGTLALFDLAEVSSQDGHSFSRLV